MLHMHLEDGVGLSSVGIAPTSLPNGHSRIYGHGETYISFYIKDSHQ
jgi:hypothetical protein